MTCVDPSTGARRRVLVVEDEFLIAEHTAALLEGLGYEVSGPVATVPEAMAAIGSEALDIVLLDANLGGTSSAPVAAELAGRGLPFVVVTGYGNLALVAPGLEDAPRLTKPVTSASLAAMLAKILTG